MAHLTLEDKNFFKENGYLIKRGVLSDARFAARDALWDGIEADRNKPETWVQAAPRVPCPGSHPAIRATVQESPVYSMMEEMVGVGQLNGGGPGPHLVFPSGDDEWTGAKHGHLDGYYTPTNGVPEGTVGYMTINVTIYVEHIEHRGAALLCSPARTGWPTNTLKRTRCFLQGDLQIEYGATRKCPQRLSLKERRETCASGTVRWFTREAKTSIRIFAWRSLGGFAQGQQRHSF